MQRGGLHSGSSGYKFIIFPSVFQSIDYKDLECLNQEGVEIKLKVQLQYRAKAKNLREIILQFKDKENWKWEIPFDR